VRTLIYHLNSYHSWFEQACCLCIDPWSRFGTFFVCFHHRKCYFGNRFCVLWRNVFIISES